VTTTHKEVAAQFAGAEEAKDAGNGMFREGDHALALACYQRALELGLGAHDGVAGADEACLYSIYANLAAAWLGARSHCRFVPPRVHFILDLLTYSVALFLKRRCDRTLGLAQAELAGPRRDRLQRRPGAAARDADQHCQGAPMKQ
jgi:hypothetical protein